MFVNCYLKKGIEPPSQSQYYLLKLKEELKKSLHVKKIGHRMDGQKYQVFLLKNERRD